MHLLWTESHCLSSVTGRQPHWIRAGNKLGDRELGAQKIYASENRYLLRFKSVKIALLGPVSSRFSTGWYDVAFGAPALKSAYRAWCPSPCYQSHNRVQGTWCQFAHLEKWQQELCHRLLWKLHEFIMCRVLNPTCTTVKLYNWLLFFTCSQCAHSGI